MIVYNDNPNLRPVFIADRAGLIDVVKYDSLVIWDEGSHTVFLKAAGTAMIEKDMDEFWALTEPQFSLENK